MKKILAFILAVGMVFSLAACGGENTGKENEKETEIETEIETETKQETKKIDYANMTEDDLIKEFIKDEQNITLDEFVNLASTYSYATRCV